MENEEKNLNTESNDIAGNRVDGPAGNTAAKPGRPGMGVGMPGGPPVAAPNRSTSSHSASSESLAESEMSAGAGAVGDDQPQYENRPADPAHLRATPGTYGGNFGNSTQASHHDQPRRDNQDSDANRGEFGVQNSDGTTHGGFGNQNRRADYEPHGTPEDAYYGGPGRPGPQENAYRAYDGRDARPDERTEYGFERGTAPAPEAGLPNDPASARANDNGAPKGPDPGYATDYGHTSLPPETDPAGNPAASQGRRNQTAEDYLPTQARHDSLGQPAAPHEGSSHGHDEGRRGGGSASSDHDRSGYVQAPDGDADQGLGSRGGSYNDAYDDSRPGSTAGSPAPGNQRREDLAGNYGAEAREENRATDEENRADHGAPQRNEGRE